MDRVHLSLLALVLLLAPLSGFWSVDWLSGVLVLIPLIALCVWLWSRRHDGTPFSLPPGSAALLFLIAWGTFQLIPLPLSLIKYLSPHAWQIYHQSVEVLAPSIWVPLSLNPQATLQVVLVLCTGSACYLLVVFLLKDRLSLKQGVLWLTRITGGLAMGLFFLHLITLLLPIFFSSDLKLAAILGRNLNSIVLLMLILGPLGLAALLAFRPTSRYGSWKERVVTYWRATVQDHFLVIVLSALVVPFSIGILSWQILLFYCGALALLGAMVMVIRKDRRDSPYILFFIVVALAAFVIGLNGGVIQQKPAQIASAAKADKVVVSRLVSNYWFTGSGLGTYSKVYRHVDRQATNPFSLVGRDPVRQLRVEGGLPFLLGIIWFIYTLLRHSWPRWRKRRNKVAIYLFVGSFSGLVAFGGAVIILGISVLPWLWYYVFVLAGMLVVTSQGARHVAAGSAFPQVCPDWRLTLGRLLIVCVLVVALFVQVGRSIAEGIFAQVELSSQETAQDALNSDSQKRLLSHSILFAPLNASYRWAFGWRLMQLGQTEKAMTYFARALRLNPLVGLEAYRLGIYLADIGQGDMAIKLMHHGVQSDWGNQSLQDDFVSRLLTQGAKTEALVHVEKILAQDPSRTIDWLSFFDHKGLSPLEGISVLADHPRCFVDYGDFLLQKDLPEQALVNYKTALHLIQAKEPFQSEIVWRLFSFFESRLLYEEALAAVLAGVRVYPENLDYMKASGILYERLGITYKAAEIYRKILMHTPHDTDIRGRLMHLQK